MFATSVKPYIYNENLIIYVSVCVLHTLLLRKVNGVYWDGTIFILMKPALPGSITAISSSFMCNVPERLMIKSNLEDIRELWKNGNSLTFAAGNVFFSIIH